MAESGDARARRVIERIQENLRTNLESTNYYEAHQLYNTLSHKYLTQNKVTEALDTLASGGKVLFDNDQFESGLDLSMKYLEIIGKNGKSILFTDHVITQLDDLHTRMPKGTTECFQFTMKAVALSSTQENKGGNPAVHRVFAHNYWKEKRHDLANRHFLYSTDGESCGKFLAEYHSEFGGTLGEMDLFIAQAVLQQLCLKHESTANVTFTVYTTNHPRLSDQESSPHVTDINTVGRTFVFPLLNFLSFLLTAVHKKYNAPVFEILCFQYKKSLERDPMYHKYLNKIATNYFGVPPKASTSGNFLSGLMNSLLSGMTDDDESSIAEDLATPTTSTSAQPNQKHSKQVMEASDVD